MTITKELELLIEDLRACHEVYCKVKCVKYALRVGANPGERHTMRCERLQAEHGFKPYVNSRENR
jgi:hypothetical protein